MQKTDEKGLKTDRSRRSPVPLAALYAASASPYLTSRWYQPRPWSPAWLRRKWKSLPDSGKRTLLWGLTLFVILLLAPFLTDYLEARLLGTTHVEDVFRWLGIHSHVIRLRDWLVLK